MEEHGAESDLVEEATEEVLEDGATSDFSAPGESSGRSVVSSTGMLWVWFEMSLFVARFESVCQRGKLYRAIVIPKELTFVAALIRPGESCKGGRSAWPMFSISGASRDDDGKPEGSLAV